MTETLRKPSAGFSDHDQNMDTNNNTNTNNNNNNDEYTAITNTLRTLPLITTTTSTLPHNWERPNIPYIGETRDRYIVVVVFAIVLGVPLGTSIFGRTHIPKQLLP